MTKLKANLNSRGLRVAIAAQSYRLSGIVTAVAIVVGFACNVGAITIVDLTPDEANSSQPGFGTNIANLLSDPFIYNPSDPTSTTPAGLHSDGFHANEGEGVDVSLWFTFTNGPVTLGADESFTVDLWGRSNCCQNRDDDYDIELYSGGINGTLVASITGQGIPDPAPQHNRSILGQTGDTFDTLRILAHDSNPSGANLFTPVELRAIIDDGVPLNPTVSINRQTGVVTLINDTAANVNIGGYSLTSAAGSFNQSGWTTVTGNYDASGNGSVDNDDNWTVLTASGAATDISEGELSGGNGGVMTVGQPINLGSAWLSTPSEDVQARLLLSDGSVQAVTVNYEGNEISEGDFDGSGDITALDWDAYISNTITDFAGLSQAQAYLAGDLTGDGVRNIRDTDRFISLYEAANGAGSFALIGTAVPEPSSVCIMIVGAVIGLGVARRRIAGQVTALAVLLVGLGALNAQPATAASVTWGPVFEIFSTSDIDTTGEVVAAVNGGPANAADITVDVGGTPITFVSPAPTILTNANFGAGGIPELASTGNAELDQVFESHTWTDGDQSVATGTPTPIALDGLINGQEYQLQFFSSADGRGCCSARTMQLLDTPDGTGNQSDFLARASDLTTSGMLRANSVIGTFTADSSTQSVWLANDTVTSNDVSTSGYILSAIGEIITLDLQVNTVTGSVLMQNNSSVPIAINSYEITSASGELDSSGWDSFSDQNIDAAGTGIGQTWDVVGSGSANSLHEGFLLGSTMFGAGDSESLGSAFNVSANGSGVDGNLQFMFRTADGGILSGNVTYVDDPSTVLFGDADNDGAVAGSDLLAVTNNFGSTGPADGLLLGDADDDGAVAGSDLLAVTNNFGSTLGSGSLTSAQVPEPSSVLMLLGACTGFAFAARRKQPTLNRNRKGLKAMTSDSSRRIVSAAIASAVAVLLANPAQADVTNDRVLLLGEGVSAGTGLGDVSENGSPGQVVGSAVSASSGGAVPANLDSVDNAGPSGAFLGLTQVGNPLYVNVNSGSLARGGTSPGDVGVQFDGTDDYLFGQALDRPENLADRLGQAYPLNYTGITSRGLQMWAYVDSAKLGTAPQTILMDSQVFGGPQITADGKWSQMNSQHSVDGTPFGGVPATVDVVPDTWQHVMHHVYNADDPGAPVRLSGGGGENFVAVVYVDGVAVSSNVDNLPSGFDLSSGGFSGRLVVGAEDDGNGGFENHFQGAVDNIEMYVFGDNTDQGGQDYGTFDLFSDNEWIAEQISALPGGVLQPGDVNKSGGTPDSADVNAFIAGWLSRNIQSGAHSTQSVGDWNTWGQGDMNHDGVTDLADLFIMNQALASAGAGLITGDMLGGTTVPEPSTVVMLGSLMVATLAVKRRRS